MKKNINLLLAIVASLLLQSCATTHSPAILMDEKGLMQLYNTNSPKTQTPQTIDMQAPVNKSSEVKVEKSKRKALLPAVSTLSVFSKKNKQ